MPALVTHHYFSTAALRSAKSYLSSAASADLSAFYWGAQGPDILFFHHPLISNPVSSLGHTMHEQRSARLFSVLVRQCAAMQSPSATAYLLGFCCHYILDRTIHPYVTYISNYVLDPQFPQLSHDPLHNLCESELDRIIVETKYQSDSTKFRAYRLLSTSKSAENAASQMLSTAAWKAYGERLSPRTVSHAMHSMLRAQYLLCNPSGRRADGMMMLEKLTRTNGAISTLMRPVHPLPVDCTNTQHQAWIDAATPHLRRYESFFDLLEQAEQPAARLMDRCYDAVQTGSRLPPDLFPLNYLGLPETIR